MYKRFHFLISFVFKEVFPKGIRNTHLAFKVTLLALSILASFDSIFRIPSLVIASRLHLNSVKVLLVMDLVRSIHIYLNIIIMQML